MQNVHVLLHPTEIDTHAANALSRWVGSVEGKTLSDSSISTAAARLCSARRSSAGSTSMLCVPNTASTHGAFSTMPSRICWARQAADRDLHARARSLDRSELAEITEKTGRSVLAHGAGVNHDDVGTHVARVCRARGGLGDRVNGDEACLLQQTRHSFGVVFVHLTAKRAHRVGARQGV